jgi:hypothetical protein
LRIVTSRQVRKNHALAHGTLRRRRFFSQRRS